MFFNVFFFRYKEAKKQKKIKGNYLVKQVPQASANRARFNPTGGMTMEE
jgi:hypothetical protein